MGTAKWMVTIRYADENYPKSYFFDVLSVAVNFYQDIKDRNGETGMYRIEIQLWQLEEEPHIAWQLIRTN